MAAPRKTPTAPPATAPPSVGEIFSLDDDFGIGPGYLPAGSRVKVDGIHEPGTPGLGLTDEPTVTVEHSDLGTTRSIALPVSTFYEIFKKVS